MIVEATREVPIQVNGKLRDKITVPAGIREIELEQIVLSRDKVRRGARRPTARGGSSTPAAAGSSTSSSGEGAMATTRRHPRRTASR